ncbi:FAD-binding oxidoreductase [Nocardioidaceae bacterium SCSIO 66511]|nr:FAD-binding oxidoreductase [Nocardioidaceae bacterium SCSIO 66511]
MSELDRRTVLRGTIAGALATTSAGASALTSSAAARTSAPAPIAAGRSGPTPADWRALERGLKGGLLRRGEKGYRKATRLFDPRFDGDHPRGIVRAANAHDVSEALRFARKFDVRLRPKSGGHSYVGASMFDKGMVIDTGTIDGIAYKSGSKRVVIGPGTELGRLHDRLDRHGRTVPTGTCPTVGAAGLVLGGGIGAESRMYGLTQDAVVDMQIVTADGKIRHANAHTNADLFWALRGGGGGNFAIVTHLTMKTFKAHRVGFFFLSWSGKDAVAVVRGWQQRLRHMPRTSWANVHLDANNGSIAARIVGLSLTGDGHHEARALIRAIGRDPSNQSYSTKSHREAMHLLAGPTGHQRQSFVAGTDVIGAPMKRPALRDLVGVVRQRARHGGGASAILDPLDGRAGKPKVSSSAFPWRNAVASLQWYVALPNPTPKAVKSGRTWIKHGHRAVAARSIGGYVNYLEPGKPVRRYYGKHWKKLRRIANKHDPQGVFRSPYSIR